MEIFYSEGIHILLDGLHFLIDPSFTDNVDVDWDDYQIIRKEKKENVNYENVDLILLTHAHSDHTDRLDYFRSKDVPLVAHPMTIEAKHSAIGEKKTVYKIMHKESIVFRDIKITAYNSGHCGGAIMFLLETSEGKILLTGDIQTQSTVSIASAQPIKCDILVIESTFGHPKYTFPPRYQTYSEIHDYLKKRFDDGYYAAFMFGHALGKIQDIVKILNDFTDMKLHIYLDQYSKHYTDMFVKYYGPIGEYKHEDDEETVLVEPHTVFLGSPMSANVEGITHLMRKFGLRKVPISIMTGWTQDRYTDLLKVFPDTQLFKISSHSGFMDLKAFIHHCEPQIVLTFHGFSEEFAKEVEKEGFPCYNIHEKSVKIEN